MKPGIQAKALMIIVLSQTACGIVSDRYVSYVQGGVNSICSNPDAAYANHLTNVYTADNCSCHVTSQPAISNDSENSRAFVQAALNRGSTSKLVEHLITGSHAGARKAAVHGESLRAWSDACN